MMKSARLIIITLTLLTAGFMALLFPTTTAWAQCGGSCNSGCVQSQHAGSRAFIIDQHNLTRIHMTQEMRAHQRWWFTDFFNQYILPAQMMMAEQLTAVGMQQMEIVGALWDAKHQLESQLLFHELTAEAHKDYHSSHGMCTLATAARGLPASDRRAETTTFILGRRSQARQLGNANASAADGPVTDKGDRITQLIRRYCSAQDENNGLRGMCETSSPSATINKDIDYNRLIETPLTIDVDFTDGTTAEGEEEDVFALASNLFSHQVFPRLSQTNAAILANNMMYYDLRSVVAKRSVAE
ncbi:MAG: hypothetical protein KJ667_02435, partial [Alphaproteobacteria bacterium]|nr:hypothetical protein [Alphaproteobacteria bacterium]